MNSSVCRMAVAVLGATVAGLVGCERPVAPSQQADLTNVSALRQAIGTSEVESGPAAAAAAQPTGWATLRGTFRLNGEPPPRYPLTVDKDLHVCAPGGRQALSEEIVVDPATKGIKDVVIYLAGKNYKDGDPAWEHPDYAAQRDAELEFDQKECVFLSHMFVMRSMQSLRILNSDPVGHNTKIDATGRAAQINATIPGNGYTPYEPGGESPEPFPVACSIHPWMSARMIVRESPYNAITAPDGSFEIARVPAGVPLEFRVWQERSKYLQDVTVNGEQQKWPRGRLMVTLEPDQEMTLDVVVNASVFQ